VSARLEGHVPLRWNGFALTCQTKARRFESVLLQNIVQNWPRKESRELARSSRDIDKSLPIIVRKKRVDSDWVQQIGEIAWKGIFSV
jgi:hypothetical protein